MTLYKYPPKINNSSHLESWVNNVLINHSITNNIFKLQLFEDYNSDAADRKDAHEIYMIFLREIKKYLNQEELDMLNAFRQYYDEARSVYRDVLNEPSILNKTLKNHGFYVSTRYGKLGFYLLPKNEFSDVNLKAAHLAYDDEDIRIILFTSDNNYTITKEDLINVFRKKRRLVHELTHYIDDVRGDLTKEAPITKDTYVNDKYEFRAFNQDIISEFGRFIFKNHINIDKNKLTDTNYINNLLYTFLSEKNPDYKYKKEELNLFMDFIEALNKENLFIFLKNVYEYLEYVYDTDKDINLSEGFNKNQLINLFRAEEYFNRKVK